MEEPRGSSPGAASLGAPERRHLAKRRRCLGAAASRRRQRCNACQRRGARDAARPTEIKPTEIRPTVARRRRSRRRGPARLGVAGHRTSSKIRCGLIEGDRAFGCSTRGYGCGASAPARGGRPACPLRIRGHSKRAPRRGRLRPARCSRPIPRSGGRRAGHLSRCYLERLGAFGDRVRLTCRQRPVKRC
jgi:hypothetical protein